MKQQFRSLVLWLAGLFASDIHDSRSGKRLGKGLVIGFRGKIHLVGYQGKPLMPIFLPQKRLTYWKQEIGFTTQEPPDFPSLHNVSERNVPEKANVMNVLLTHKGAEAFESLRQLWRPVCKEENLWVVFGGSTADFEALDYPRKVFIDDPKLRTHDHQREKQSYMAILKALAPIVEREQPDYIYLCEYDHLPLVADLNERQITKMMEEEADVMGHWLHRMDGTGHPHLLFHEGDSKFHPFWASISKRDNPSVVLTMFGSGSFWTRDAFLTVAAQSQDIECYLEIYLPTVAHHLGFRVRGWNEENHLISNLPSSSITVAVARERGCWTIHPVKEPPKAVIPHC